MAADHALDWSAFDSYLDLSYSPERSATGSRGPDCRYKFGDAVTGDPVLALRGAPPDYTKMSIQSGASCGDRSPSSGSTTGKVRQHLGSADRHSRMPRGVAACGRGCGTEAAVASRIGGSGLTVGRVP